MRHIALALLPALALWAIGCEKTVEQEAADVREAQQQAAENIAEEQQDVHEAQKEGAKDVAEEHKEATEAVAEEKQDVREAAREGAEEVSEEKRELDAAKQKEADEAAAKAVVPDTDTTESKTTIKTETETKVAPDGTTSVYVCDQLLVVAESPVTGTPSRSTVPPPPPVE